MFQTDYPSALQDIIEWDVKNWSTSLDFWLKQSSINLVNGNGLELGSRNGGLSLWLALKGCQVVCSDIKGPTEKAKALHESYGISQSIQYHTIDATSIPYDDHSFDVVVFKSMLGGVGAFNNKEAQRKAMKEIYRVLKPHGELFFAENLVASPIHKALRKRFVRWGEGWRYPSIDEMNELLSDFSQVYSITTGFIASFGRNETQRSLLSSVDQVFHRLVPDHWKYIMIGVAKK